MDYVYRKKEDAHADQEFAQASQYGKVKIGKDLIFWKKGLKWNVTDLDGVTRAFRRIEAVDAKMCCGNVNFDVQKLVLVRKDGEELELLIGEGTVREADALYQRLQESRPEITYGKEK